MDFLISLAEQVRPLAEMEVSVLHEAKKVDPNADDGRIEQWDVAYYQRKVREQVVGMNSSDFGQYFSLANVFKGLEVVAYDVFGVHLNKVPIAKSEAWTSEYISPVDE